MLLKCAILFELIVKVLCLTLNLYEEHINILSYYMFNNVKRESVQILDLRGNGIDSISDTAFSGLYNVNTLAIMQNNIICLPENVFDGVQNVTFLGLDENKIKYLHKNTFCKLRKVSLIRLQNNLLSNLEIGLFDNNLELGQIILQNNRLTFIPDGLFSHLPKLFTLDLSMNFIHYVDKFSFPHTLRNLYIFANKLQNFNIDGNVLNSLATFNLDKNPWYCDCNLKPVFQQWKAKFITNGWIPVCEGPISTRYRSWTDLTGNNFVCNQNDIEFHLENNGFVLTGQTVVLPCRINRLVSDITISHNNTQSNNKLYSTQSASTQQGSWYNLTIENVQMNDGGQYQCVVNVNGKKSIEKIVTLTVEDPYGNTCCEQ